MFLCTYLSERILHILSHHLIVLDCVQVNYMILLMEIVFLLKIMIQLIFCLNDPVSYITIDCPAKVIEYGLMCVQFHLSNFLTYSRA